MDTMTQERGVDTMTQDRGVNTMTEERGVDSMSQDRRVKSMTKKWSSTGSRHQGGDNEGLHVVALTVQTN